MALIKCKECRIEVSDKAKNCPNCGAPIKSRIGCGGFIVIMFCIGIVLYNVPRIFSPSIQSQTDSSDPHQKPSAVHYTGIGELTTLKTGYPLAATKELFDKAVDIIIAKDSAALMKLISSGLVRFTEEGEEVYYEGSNWGVSKVRPKGSTVSYYTNIEAVKNE